MTTEATTPFAIEALARPLDAARRAMRADTRLYLEPRWEAETWRTRGEDLLHVLRAAADTGPAVGLKVRCAGETALDHETLAHVLLRVADEGLPLKVTQGLHHPLIEAATYGNAHGFLGLAAALWYRAALGPAFSEEDMRACLGSSTATDLDLADGLSWRAHAIAETVLLAARERVPLSIGSCSISEPDADLARLFPTAPVTPEQAR